MGSVKEIILAVSLLIGGGYAIEKIHNQVRFMTLEKAHRGLDSLVPYTKKLTGINPKRIEQGYLE